ncbi:MAG: MFS transporter [Marinifilaceae bacterium]|jgi:hypothetical protein|nr:MFS transporter [Marinifilaceae bacterium]
MKNIKANKMYRYLILLAVVATAGQQGWRTLFNNFAVDTVGINGLEVGIIQSVREVPGFLSLLVIYLLFIIKEHKLSAISIAFMGLGVMIVGFFPSFIGLVVTTFLFSTGFHFFETTNKSLTLQHFSIKEFPIVFARQKSYGAIANIVIGGFVWLLDYAIPMEMNYLLIGAIVLVVGIYCYTLNPIDKDVVPQQRKMVIKRKYWLFYLLNFLSGARRQIFVVFAVFMLVQKYHFTVKEVAILFIINNIVNYYVSPIIGKAINKYGERLVLSVEYIAIILVFGGYAFIENKWAVTSFYIIDNIFFGCSMAINTYFHKTGETKDIAPSMALGFTINHISAVVIPVIGGLLWMMNWRTPFIFAMILGVVSLLATQKIGREKL